MEVFLRVSQTIGGFRSRSRSGSFRSWLFQLTSAGARFYDKVQDRLRKQSKDENLDKHEEQILVEAQQGEELEKRPRRSCSTPSSIVWKAVYLVKQLQAFRMMVVDEVPVEKVCDLFKITPNFAYVIRHRVLAKLKVEAKKLPLSKRPAKGPVRRKRRRAFSVRPHRMSTLSPIAHARPRSGCPELADRNGLHP